jgi:hypothetical protein
VAYCRAFAGDIELADTISTEDMLHRIHGYQVQDDIAKRNHLPTAYITEDWIRRQLVKQDHACYACGEKVDRSNWSVDRKNDSLAHIRSNCAIACLACNKAHVNRIVFQSFGNQQLDDLATFLLALPEPSEEDLRYEYNPDESEELNALRKELHEEQLRGFQDWEPRRAIRDELSRKINLLEHEQERKDEEAEAEKTREAVAHLVGCIISC